MSTFIQLGWIVYSVGAPVVFAFYLAGFCPWYVACLPVPFLWAVLLNMGSYD